MRSRFVASCGGPSLNCALAGASRHSEGSRTGNLRKIAAGQSHTHEWLLDWAAQPHLTCRYKRPERRLDVPIDILQPKVYI
jgi:hypothetical protein